uniref:Uncharacterized protein n=1 Tax=Setaria digitata TaxID=48799 RepID=A0A915PD96_9BILA
MGREKLAVDRLLHVLLEKTLGQAERFPDVIKAPDLLWISATDIKSYRRVSALSQRNSYSGLACSTAATVSKKRTRGKGLFVGGSDIFIHMSPEKSFFLAPVVGFQLKHQFKEGKINERPKVAHYGAHCVRRKRLFVQLSIWPINND